MELKIMPLLTQNQRLINCTNMTFRPIFINRSEREVNESNQLALTAARKA